MIQQIRLQLEKETKNTLRFSELGRVPVLYNGTLYIYKHLFPSSTPQTLIITLSTPEEEK